MTADQVDDHEDIAAALARGHDVRGRIDLDRAGAMAWRKHYSRGVLISDVLVLAVTAVLAQAARFGFADGPSTHGPFNMSYTSLGAVIAVMWWGTLEAFRTRDVRVLGVDSTEYRRIVRATVFMFGWLAILSLMFKWDMSRGYLAIAFPLGLIGLLTERKLWRVWLRRHRRTGSHVTNVLVIGGQRSAQEIALTFDRNRGAGMRVTGVWVPDAKAKLNEYLDVPNQFIPVLGTDRTLKGALAVTEADTIIVTDTEHIGHDGLRELTWQLEGVDIDLMVSPNVVDVAGSRLHLTELANMPFIHLEEPQYAEAGAWPKAFFDRIFAGGALLAFSPFFLLFALLVKTTSSGPVLYRQSRVGLDGRPFDMLKFRSMVADADARLSELLTAQGSDGTPLFKVDNDPRITRIGRFMRRYSIDELPQLLNVLRGEMSVVGPRPQREAEVALYEHRDYRRLRVRPGMTGLWQVSGRSDLSWEDAIRLDTYYVENWSMVGDLVILSRTIRAVFGSRGAY